MRLLIKENKPNRLKDFNEIIDNGNKQLKDINILLLGLGQRNTPRLADKVIITLNSNGVFMGTIVNANIIISKNNYVIKSSVNTITKDNVFSIHDTQINRSNNKVLITGECNIQIECEQNSPTEILLISTKPFSVDFSNKDTVLSNASIYAAYTHPYPDKKEEEEVFIPDNPVVMDLEEKEKQPQDSIPDEIPTVLEPMEVVKQPTDDFVLIPGFHHHHFRAPHIHKEILSVLKEDETIKSSINESCKEVFNDIVEEKIKATFTEKQHDLLIRKLDIMTKTDSFFDTNIRPKLYLKVIDPIQKEIKQRVEELKKIIADNDNKYMAHIKVLQQQVINNQISANSPNNSYYSHPIPYNSYYDRPINPHQVPVINSNNKKRPLSPTEDNQEPPTKKRKTK